jgi:hypothetical protein
MMSDLGEALPEMKRYQMISDSLVSGQKYTRGVKGGSSLLM